MKNSVADSSFPYNFQNKEHIASTGIDLWGGPSDAGELESESVLSEVILRYGYSAYRLAVLDGFEGTEQEWLESLIGPQGKSAYQVAVDNGFEGTVAEWLASLVGAPGKSAYQVAVDNGFEGTEQEWLESLIGPQGKSAYQVAVDNGFEGTVAEWLASLKGPAGDSAYELAVQEGFEGTEEEWLESLQGETGPQGPQGEQGETGPAGVTDVEVQVDSSSGHPSGTGVVDDGLLKLMFTGLKGESAYELAVLDGYEGTEEEWLASLVGPQGPQGIQGVQGEQGIQGETGPQGVQGNTGASVDYPYELVNNRTTDDATKGLSAAEGKRLGDDLSQLEHEVHQLAGKFYGVFADDSDLPEGDAVGYAFVGTENPYAIWNFDGEEWSDSGSVANGITGEPGVGFSSIFTPQPYDGTMIIVLSNNDTITVDLNHNHEGYYSKVLGGTQPSGGFLPDVVYSLGTLAGTITFSLAAAVTGNVNHYFWMFDTSSTAPNITWPAGLTWAAGSAPTVAANKHYEISILGGIAYYSEV